MEERQEDKVVFVELSKIIPLPLNVSIIDPEEDMMLRTDMTRVETKGWYKIDPILLRRLSPQEIEQLRTEKPWSVAEYQIIDGHKRFYAAKELGWSKIRAIITDATLEEARAINYMKNKARGKVDPLREALYFHHLYEDLKMTMEQIGEKFGLTRQRVEQILRRAKVTKEARAIMSRRLDMEISGAHLEVIGSLPPEKQPEIAKAIVEEKLGFREAELVKEAVEKGVPTQSAVKVVKAVKPIAKPKEVRKVVQVVSVKPELAEELVKLPEEKLKAKVEELIRPPPPPPKPEEIREKLIKELEGYYPPILIDYAYTRYKGELLKEVIKASIFYMFWEKLTEAQREEVMEKAIKEVEEKGKFVEPVIG